MNSIDMIEQSNKEAPKLLLQHILYDARSVTGSNFRHLMLEFNVRKLSELNLKGYTQHPTPENEEWRIGVAIDAINALNNVSFINDIGNNLMKDILDNVCIT